MSDTTSKSAGPAKKTSRRLPEAPQFDESELMKALATAHGVKESAEVAKARIRANKKIARDVIEAIIVLGISGALAAAGAPD